ncbi:LysR family transcriptional regulator [Paenibacillus sp. MWE-103]|uniref:LysR family transcriptional regulator n=1 Tax=Paenibacillus artemisiicola TaxID=1172618 RepID=A0ABS3WKM4_9BACL|nr:LysR family transcriptional regulator [Paenibacillus artemisiicola]MBO7748876.1 LysR family transcriptional regulator [Paenibacillus artemisiicola]
MELLQLHYFRTVARLQHMTKAAEELRIAQPSLSKTIARLEHDVGVPLFDREGRHIRLNAYGGIFLRRLERAFMELDEAKREIGELAGKEQNCLKLAVSITKMLPALMGAFARAHPEVHVRQFLAPVPSMLRQLEKGEVDLCIASLKLEGPEIEWLPLLTEEVFLALPPGHRLAGRERVALRELERDPFIGMNAGYAFRELTDGFCRQAGFEPRVAFELDEPDAIIGLVKQNLGVTFIPASEWKPVARLLPHRTRIAEPACYRTIGLAWSKRRHPTKAASAFKELVVAHYRRLAEEAGGDGTGPAT